MTNFPNSIKALSSFVEILNANPRGAMFLIALFAIVAFCFLVFISMAKP